jgi:pimeloyl-[acyl-carrier protein] synthase
VLRSALARLGRPRRTSASSSRTFDGAVDLYDPAVIADPYPTYRRLREADTVHRDADGTLLLTRYADVTSLVADPRLLASRPVGVDRRVSEDVGRAAHAVWSKFGETLLMTDSPDHERVRSVMSPAFAPRVVEGMRWRIQEVADELLADVGANGRMDLVHEFAAVLPLRVICELFGIPPEGERLVKRCSDDLHLVLGLAATAPASDAQHLRGAASLRELVAYVEELIAARTVELEPDLLGALVLIAEEEPDRISHGELVANTILILGAGHETTADVIATGTLALLRHPEELQRLRDDPGLLASAVEEMLRYDAPVQLCGRRADARIELEGATVKPGDWVTFSLGAANRDPAAFPDPDRFDAGRAGPQHVSFSYGGHYCLGAPLARLETQVAISSLLAHFDELELASEKLRWRSNPGFRGLLSLPVRFSRSRPGGPGT